MRSALLVPPLLFLACAHGAFERVSASSEFTRIAPGKAYEGTEERIDRSRGLPFVGPTKFRFFGEAGQRVRFKYTTRPTDGFGRALTLRLGSEGTKVPLQSDEKDAFELDTGVLPLNGEYELECSPGVVDAQTADFRLEFNVDPTRPVVTVAENQTIKGELTADDRTDLGAGPTDLYLVRLDGPGKRLAFATRAEGTKLRVAVHTFDDGEFPEMDSSGWGSFSDEAHVTYVKQYALIKVYGPEDKPLGPYELTVSDGRTFQIGSLPVVRLGGEVEGELEAAGGKKDDAVFHLRGKVGQVYDLVASSDAADVVLIVTNAEIDPSALKVAADDDSGGGTNARLRLQLPDEQPWMVLVRNKGKSGGPFKLRYEIADLSQPGPATQTPKVIRR